MDEQPPASPWQERPPRKPKFGEFTYEQRMANLEKARAALAQKRELRLRLKAMTREQYELELGVLVPKALEALHRGLLSKNEQLRIKVALAVLDRKWGSEPAKQIAAQDDYDKTVLTALRDAAKAASN